ncbi:MAG: MFS transporter, partial [Opitutaceae bacterium]
MQEPAAFAVLAHRDFRYFLISRFLSAFSLFMVGVAVGWQVYDLTHDPLALGFVGLAQFLPAFLLTLPGGVAADRFDRRRVLLVGYLLELTVAALFLLMTYFSVGKIGIIYAVVALIGVGRAILTPASLSLVPVLVPQEQLVRAVAWSSSAFQAAMIAGPAVGGFLYALGPIYVYAVAVCLLVIAAYLAIRLKVKLMVRSASSVGIKDLFAGVTYVFERKV